MGKYGVLLLNFGGPGHAGEVRPFLYRLFSDKYVLYGMPAPLRHLIAPVLALTHAPASARYYAAIGGGSPQLRWTREQAAGLEVLLNRDAVFGEAYKVSIGMRSWKPDIRSGLEELRDWGAEKLTLLPLYPQYSFSTTRSSLEEARRQLDKMGWKPELREVRSWPSHPAYIGLLRALLDETLARASAGGARPHVIFSAHSLPVRWSMPATPTAARWSAPSRHWSAACPPPGRWLSSPGAAACAGWSPTWRTNCPGWPPPG